MELSQHSMPREVEQAYDVWRFGAGRNISETARLCGMAKSTVHRWIATYKWRELAHDDDITERRDAIGHGWARLVRSLSDDITVVERAIASVYGPDGKPRPGDPTPTAAKTALTKLAILGMAPQRQVTLDVSHTLTPSVTDAELDALLAAGDTAGLLALMLGHQRTPPDPPTPPDFASGQAGGRAGPEPHSPVAEHAPPELPPDRNFHTPPWPPTPAPDLDPDVLEAVFSDTSEPAPERHYHPGGDDYDEVPQ